MHFMTILTLGLAGSAIALPHAPRASATPTPSVSLTSVTPTVITSASASASASPAAASRFPDPRSILLKEVPSDIMALQKTYYYDYHRYQTFTGKAKELWAHRLEGDLNALRVAEKAAGIPILF
ncbi:uncharacterized protein N7483_007340 [Penicillium malachiteum]|uniref:uncharacterized protein n=1 Tax=Penicillium malachiteum TaxID=1324776 RepID=UPI0025470DC9|nr:uncharacterized protein N7483_007340 [Penicillium malachiteum]KAJ5725983.1 hypothetical protein N7483_007340 [Penicillium malachiteum]